MSKCRGRFPHVAIDRLSVIVASGRIPQARTEWGGANVVIASHGGHGRYREIVTKHARELSWLFGCLRDACYGVLESCNKFEFYGRLEREANNAISADPALSASALCGVVIAEARKMVTEILDGKFSYLLVASDVLIAADLQD